ncbi:MAG TPA: FHA domain-containing protein, partial [Blastocatellia bacterium]|nr:FHA domain-containing protein [Blastocatellia bacterium]
LREKRPSTADLMRPPGAPSFGSSPSPPRPAVPASQGGHAEGTMPMSSGHPQAAQTSGPAPVPSTSGSSGNKAVLGSSPARLIIERGGRIGKEFAVGTGETNIGRWDADGGIFPDVDLDQDDPEAKVSRRHARIIQEKGQFYIEDLGSTNGTFINRGRRLLPGNRHPLNNGDEIIVGKTFLKFVVEGAPY